MAQRAAQQARHSPPDASGGPEGNARLTSSIAAVLFVLLFLEGLTTLQIGRLVGPHVFIGVVLIPPILVKVALTTWRFVKYYRGDPDYRRKGPPPLLLRLFAPLVIVLTVAVVASGVALVVVAPSSWHARLLQLHQATFLLWFLVTAVHVLSHLVETATLAPRDWFGRTRRQVNGASIRQWVLASSLALGLVAAFWITPYAANWTVISN
jgi:hypothetical protein